MKRISLLILLSMLLSQLVIAQRNDEQIRIDEPPTVDSLKVDVMPYYPEGMRSFYNYVAHNFKYPASAVENGISGRIVIAFIVGVDGKLSEFDVIEDLGYGTAQEVIRILESSPSWSPAIKNGKPVRAPFAVPVIIKLNENTERQPFGGKSKKKKQRLFGYKR